MTLSHVDARHTATIGLASFFLFHMHMSSQEQLFLDKTSLFIVVLNYSIVYDNWS